MTNLHKLLFLFIFGILTIGCAPNAQKDTIKFQPDDPFKNSMVQSQFLDIDTKEDNVVEGENGTIIICPQGCFLNNKGQTVVGKVKIELAEALSLQHMIQSNLTTTSNGALLETDGMIYLNATKENEQLRINPAIPIRIEIPTLKKKAGMKVYQGSRDEKGNMNWDSPVEMDKYLQTVDLNSLNFWPEEFQAAVEAGLPIRNIHRATTEAIDSLYYAFSVGSANSLLLEALESSDFYQYYLHGDSTQPTGTYQRFWGEKRDDESITPAPTFGIDPAIIKVIKSEQYQNTLIATKEFQARLRVIFKTCDKALLELYINNLNKNLYEIDEMAAEHLKEKLFHQAFHDFAQQKLTKVKNADKYAILLKGYYEKQLKKVKEELGKERDQIIQELQKARKKAEKLSEKHTNLLWQRERYRMETYGFEWTKMGWINIDRGVIPKDFDSHPLEVTVQNGQQFDRVHTYLWLTSITSLEKLNTTDNAHFFVGNEQNKTMLMPTKQKATVISIGYKNDIPAMAIKEFETATESKITFSLEPTTQENLEAILPSRNSNEKENSIILDLYFMNAFNEMRQQQKVLEQEKNFIRTLWWIVYPCSPVYN